MTSKVSKNEAMKSEAEGIALQTPPVKKSPPKAASMTRVATTTVMQPIARRRATILTGEEIIGGGDEEELTAEAVTFVSENKDLSIFIEDYEYSEVDGEILKVPLLGEKNTQAMKMVRFVQGVFRTNNPITIEQIRNYKVGKVSVLGKTIFEGALPQHILEKQEEYRKYFTRDPQEHEPSYYQ